MNLKAEQQILIKDIFSVRVCHKEGQSDNVYLLKDFPNEIKNLGDNISLVEHSTYYDSLLMERLQVPGTELLAYLEDCLSRSHYAIEKPWNQSELAQKFIKYSIEIVKNFIYLSCTEPDIFPDQLVIDNAAAQTNQKMQAIAMTLLSHFERRGFNQQILEVIHPKINEDVEGNLAESFLEVLIARERFQTIIDPKAFFYLNILQNVCSIPEFKMKFFNMSKMSFIPSSLDKITGSMLDIQSPFGVFSRQSILGNYPGYFHQEIEASGRFEERMMLEFGKQHLNKDRMKFYANLQNQFYVKLTDLFKLFLRKDTQKTFFEWVYSAIIGNLHKAKLGSRLHGANNKNLSHDGLVINIFVCLLNLCKGFLSKQTETYKKISPQYLMFNSRMARCKYEPLKKREGKEVSKMDLEKEFGTVTEFFFLCFEMLHIGFVPSQDTLVELYEHKQRMEKQKAGHLGNNYMLQKFQRQIENTQSKMIRYYISVLDDAIIMPTVKLFNMFLFLLPRWLGFDYENLQGGRIVNYQPTELAYYIPEHMVDSIHKFHFNNFKFKPHYLQILSQEHLHQIIKLTCLMLSEVQVSTNPYVAANFVELIFFFLQQNRSGLMHQVFKNNWVAHTNLEIGLVKFYCDIAVTGSANAFYEKFKYRFYVNKIFTSLWLHEVYREDLKRISKGDIYQRFINQMMSDTTYCLDETNQAYEEFKTVERKKEKEGKLDQEDLKTEEQTQSRIHATLQQVSSNTKVIRDLSRWSPETFLSQASLSTIVPLLNSFLYTFIEPTTFVANRQLVAKFKFEKEIVFSDVVQIYCNLNIDENLANEIVKDHRYYQMESFTKALQKASNERYTDIESLQNFEVLLTRLAKSQGLQEYNQDIFGEIPEKYSCQMMMTLMKQPVELPTSGSIVDRVYIHKALLIDERDPFNRAPLKYKDIIERKDLKLEIEQWKEKRLQELKGADKEAKYGKISVNKKEKEDDDPLYNDKILDYEDKQ